MSRVTADRAVVDPGTDDTITDRDWRNLSARLTATVGAMSGRADVIARIAPGMGRGAAAVFVIPIAQIEVDPDECLPAGTNPEHVDPRTPSGRRAHPVLVGACAHEAGHAAYSKWLTPAGTGAAAASAAGLLEETRMEGRYVAGRPGDRAWLQASAAELVAGCDPEHAEPIPVPWSAARLAALLCARADAGVLDHDKVAPVEARVRKIVGDDTFDELRSIWLEAHACADDDAEGMVTLGARWCDAVGVDPTGPDPDKAVTQAAVGDPTATESGTGADTGAGSGDEQEPPDDTDPDSDGTDDAAGDPDETDPGADSSPDSGSSSSSGDADLDAAVQQSLTDTAEAAEDQISGAFAASHARASSEVEARTTQARIRSRAAETAAKVMDGTLDRRTSGNRSGTRRPTPTERATAVRLGRALDQARYRAPAVTKVTTDAPPGRVRFSAAMQLDRQAAMGLPETAKPFRAKRFTRQAEPDPKVAVLCDVSGSMGMVTAAVASTGWILAEAAHRVHADVTTLLLGSGVTPLTKPGERTRDVQEFDAEDWTEAIFEALEAADGMLGLTGGTGPRLVFIVSDANFTPEQHRATRAKIQQLTTAGVTVVWIPFGNYDENALPEAATAVADSTTELGDVIGRVVLDAVRAAA